MHRSLPSLPHAVAALVSAVLAVALVMAVGPQASSHTELRESTPADGDIVEALDEVTLTFTSGILDVGAELTLTDGSGEVHELEPEVDAGSSVRADVAGIATGGAELAWRVVAEDGHPITGVIAFEYIPLEPTEAPAPTDEPTAAATPADPAPASPSPSPTASPDEPAEPADLPVWVWVLIAIAVAGSAAVAILVARRRG